MLAHDLRRRVALEALRPGVPARDLTGGIEHVDRVVGDRLKQEPMTFVFTDRHRYGFSHTHLLDYPERYNCP